MKARFVECGVKTRILYEGRGEPIMLLHGIGHSADLFLRNIDVLGEHFAVLAPDLPGHGFSEGLAFSGQAPQLASARHLMRLADDLELGRFSVLGSSYGALVAALMWFERPESIRKLVLVGSGSVFHPTEEQPAVLAAVYENGSRAMRNASLASCRERLANICYSASSVPEEALGLQVTSYALPGRLEAYKETIEELIASCSSREAQVQYRLDQLAVDTLVITGREDSRARWQAHEEGCRRMPKARLEVFEKCGHLPYVERPDRFNQRVAQFLSILA